MSGHADALYGGPATCCRGGKHQNSDIPEWRTTYSVWMQPDASECCRQPACQWIVPLGEAPAAASSPADTTSSGQVQPGVGGSRRSAQLRRAPSGVSGPADTPGQNVTEGLRKAPARRNRTSCEAVRCEKQENTHSLIPAPNITYIFTTGQATIFRSNDGPAKTMGGGREDQTSAGPLVPCPSGFVGPRKCERSLLVERA